MHDKNKSIPLYCCIPMFFLLSCTQPKITLHELFSSVAQEYQLPTPELFDPSTSIIQLSPQKKLSLQERHDDVELMLYTGMQLSQAATIQNASLALHQIGIINYELAANKVQVDPENTDIILSCFLDVETLHKSLLERRVLQLIKDEQKVRETLSSALY